MIQTVCDDFRSSISVLKNKDIALLSVLFIVLPSVLSSSLPGLIGISILGHALLFPFLLRKINSNSSQKVNLASFNLASLLKYCLFVFMATLLETIGFILFFIPGVFIGKNLLMVSVLSLLPNASISKVFSESSALMRKQGWTTYWTVFLYLLLSALLSGWDYLYRMLILPLGINPLLGFDNLFLVDTSFQLIGIFISFFMVNSRISNSYLIATL